MITDKNKTASEFLKLIDIMSTLRSPEGCPWDRKQTISSLKPYLLEETYELLDALDSNQHNDIRDELGDLLLQIVFLAEIHSEKNLFDIGSVAQSINSKMIRRHPHVFADEDPNNHNQRWEQIKGEERSNSGKTNKLKDRIPNNLPALKRASKITKRSPPTSPTKIIDDLMNEMQTLKNQLNKNSAHENNFDICLGNMLYSLVHLCTNLQSDAEEILRTKTKQVITAIDDQNQL
jgi:nucleoside triphosphate diphosphatase